MSLLNLTVDSVDNAAAYGLADVPPQSTKKGSIRSALTPQSKTGWTGRTDYTEAKMATILRDFLQPDSKVSLHEISREILALIPANAVNNAEVGSFGEICVELAEQIPYDHPSQLKLAQLLHSLSHSPKFIYTYPSAAGEETHKPFQLLRESISDGVSERDRRFWPNLNAFTANLFATGMFGPSPGRAVTLMRCAFEEKTRNTSGKEKGETEEESWERHCDVIAAAQWVLGFGQALYKLVAYDGIGDEIGENGRTRWWLDKDLEASGMTARSIERWRFWRAGFEAVSNEIGASEECKRVSARAAALMDALEESMLV